MHVDLDRVSDNIWPFREYIVDASSKVQSPFIKRLKKVTHRSKYLAVSSCKRLKNTGKGGDYGPLGKKVKW